MEVFLLVCLIAIALVRWVYLRERLDEIESRIQKLASAIAAAPGVTPSRMEPVPAPTPTPTAAAVPLPVSFQTTAPPPAMPPHPTVPVNVAPTPPATRPRPTVPVNVAAPPSAIPPRPTVPANVPPPRPTPPPTFGAPAVPQRSGAEWEALLGGNWLNKLGVFVLVIGMALALAYSYKLLGPAGRVAVSLAISFSMLAAGVVGERRERYRVFARGLIGGGWAALYFTVYAMQALEPARLIHNAWTGAFLLMAVALGMIVHSLRYRSQTVTGLAYFIAFGTLAITQVTALSLIALIPLAASLLYIARRFRWSRMAVFGLIATYVVCATRPDNGAPLWQAQTIFAIYWLLFEAFDLFCADPWLLPLNAAGFLGLSIYKWQTVAPAHLWQFLAATAAAYLAGAILRAYSNRWHPAITLTAALSAIAMFLKLEHQWLALALLIEGEVFYLAGARLRAGYLRTLAGLLFAVQVSQLLAGEIGQVPVRAWTPIAALGAACFYLNRALRSDDAFYGFAAAGLAATVAGFEASDPYRATVWLSMALVPFALGWWRRWADFRLQGYLLALLGLTGAALDPSRLSLSVAAAVSYGVTLWVLVSPADRFDPSERDIVPGAGSLAAAVSMAALLWRVVPAEYLGLSWMAMALLLLELGLRGMPKHFCRQAYALAAIGAMLNYGPWEHPWIPAAAAALAYAMAARAREQEGGAVVAIASTAGTGFAMAAAWVLLPAYAVAPAWMALALVLSAFDTPAIRLQTHGLGLAAMALVFGENLQAPHRMPAITAVLLAHYFLAWRTRQRLYLYSAAALAAVLMHYEVGRDYIAAAWAAFGLALLCVGRRWKLVDLGWQSCALAALAFAQCWAIGVEGAAPVIACLYAAQILSERGTPARTYFSVLATALITLVPHYHVEGSLRTVVWGGEGVVLLGSGFPLRDRVLRISGLALLLGCILKLFVWDLRHLETMPRILSFIVLGLFLVGVSWIYTRFRERVSQYL